MSSSTDLDGTCPRALSPAWTRIANSAATYRALSRRGRDQRRGARRLISGSIRIAATDGRPVFSFDWMVGKFGARHPFQTGIWPLASDGRTADLCIAVEDYLKLRTTDMKPSAVLQAH
jgi:hypothetical protein